MPQAISRSAALCAASLVFCIAATAQAKPRGASRPGERTEAQQASERANELVNEKPPEFVPERSWVNPIMRFGAGVGVYSLENDAPDNAKLSGVGLSLWTNLGDSFFDFLGYHVHLGFSTLGFSAIETNAQTFDNYNSTSAYSLEAGLGLNLWLWPRIISLSGTLGGQVIALEAAPVRRTDYTLQHELAGLSARGRLSFDLGVIGIHAEYAQLLPMSNTANEADTSSWTGFQAMIHASFNYGGDKP